MSEIATRNGLYGFEYREEDRRRADQGERKTYDIKALWQRHHEIVALAALGYKQTDIAEILSLDPQTVSNTLNSELGQRKLSELRSDRDGQAKRNIAHIQILTERALNVYHEIFENENGQATLKDRKEVADTVLLELSGLRTPTKIISRHTQVTLTSDEIEEFKRRGIAAAKESGLIVEVNPEPASPQEQERPSEAEPETTGNEG